MKKNQYVRMYADENTDAFVFLKLSGERLKWRVK